jgi:hypothetical protein
MPAMWFDHGANLVGDACRVCREGSGKGGGDRQTAVRGISRQTPPAASGTRGGSAAVQPPPRGLPRP